jgi:hypothetical protein
MRHPDLMGPDLLSEIVLLGSAALVFAAFLAILVAALSKTPGLS